MSAIKTIVYSSHFERALQKLPLDVHGEAEKREMMFRQDCFDPRLRTHKLKGKYNDYWSFSITHSHRIVFRFLSSDMVYFVDIGGHSVYK